MRHIVLITVLLVHKQISGQILKDVLKKDPSLNRTFVKKFMGIDLTSIATDEPSNRLSSSHWSIRVALHRCLQIRYDRTYIAYLYGPLLSLKRYYQFCVRGNDVAHVQEFMAQCTPECMRFKFSEPTLSRNARIWDIHVPLGFHINLTVTDLQITYHPRGHCHGSLVKDGRYTGQGLAIGNYTAICQRVKHHSYWLPVTKVRVILNYTRLPDRPHLEFLYEAIFPWEPLESSLTLLRLNFFNVYYFRFSQNTKTRLILYIKTWVRLAMSLVNVTLVCKNNSHTCQKLYFLDGPAFLVRSYLRSDALIASMDCKFLASYATNASLKGNDGQYLYLDVVKASIGDLVAVLEDPEEDLSMLNFRFRNHPPDIPYSHFNLTDYTNKKTGFTSESVLANLKLPEQGRHFHVLYWLQRHGWEFQVIPRLVFRIKKFDMVSFQDGCHTGGIFIAEGLTTLARYCSQAGVTYLNSTAERGGILFGFSPLVLILKGYAWFASIHLTISVSYDRCLGVTNICDKFRDNSPIFPHKCDGSLGVPCRYAVPAPCIEIVRLPSDALFDYSEACEIISHIDRSPAFGFIPFPTTILMTFGITGHANLQRDLQEVSPRIYPEYMYDTHFMSMFSFRDTSLKLQKTYSLQSQSIITRITNTYPWLGIGHWIRLLEVPGCPKEAVSLEPLEPLQILGGCGELGMTSATGHAKISIHRSVFTKYQGSIYSSEVNQFLNVAIYLLKQEEASNYSAERFFNAELHWSSVDGFEKRLVYTKRLYLEIKIFSQFSTQQFSIKLKWNRFLDNLQLVYIRRAEVVSDKWRNIRNFNLGSSWIGGEQPEVCSGKMSSCYRYQEAGDVTFDVTWNIAQARCLEHNSSLVSINSPEELHSLLAWAYNFHATKRGLPAYIAAIEAFKGRVLFIGQQRMHVSQLVTHVDGSPVTMYDWGMPSVYHPNKVSWMSVHANITYTSPHFLHFRKTKSLCTGLVFMEAAEPVLLEIPCELPIPNAVYLCERHDKQSSSLCKGTVTGSVCPYQWVEVRGDCYSLYKLNPTSRSGEDELCQRGEIVNYGQNKQILRAVKADVNAYRDPNEVLLFLALWLEDTKASVLLRNNVFKTVPVREKYIVVWLPQFTENIATSPLSALSGMKRYVTSFEGMKSLATSHVFCETSSDHVMISCASNEITCDNGTCILDMYRCDGILHCQDGSDETACKPFCNVKQQGSSTNTDNNICAELCEAPSCICDGMFFQCRNGGCVPWSHVCDCQRHCRDGSDEEPCLLCYHGTDLHYPSETGAKYAIPQKQPGTFVCGDKRKIPLDWVGDLVSDCHGTSDDELLYHMFLSTRKSNFTGCPSGYTTCIDGFGKCFPVEATCAFEKDKHGKTKYCPNGTHFLSCDMLDCHFRYKCPYSYCIAIHMVCDGQIDCPNGEDEGLFCQRHSCPGMLRCSESSVCVHPRHIGDGTPHCVVSADDERVYTSVCEPLCKCHGMIKNCFSGWIEISMPVTPSETWTVIILQNNTLKSVPHKHLSNTLLVFDLSFNQITQLHPGEFRSLYNLHELRLKGNQVGFIQSLTFFGLNFLHTLTLTSNRISTLSVNSFLGLYNIVTLQLENNAIKHIEPCAFEGLNKIKVIILKRNRLIEINSPMLCGLEKVQYLDLSFNLLRAIHLPHTLPGVTIYVQSAEYCCLLLRRSGCVPTMEDETVRHTCPKMLHRIEFIIWFLVLATFLPNIAAPICWRQTKREHGNMTFLISLLHTVDALTAVSLSVVAVADVWYGISYKRYAVEWTESLTCKGAAYVGYVAFMLSTGCMTLITRQRYLGVAYPLHKRKISKRVAMAYVLAVFIISSACVVITFLLSSQTEPFQLNSLCLIYTQPTGGLKSSWISCLYVVMDIFVIPVISYSIGTVHSLTKVATVLQRKRKKTKPIFKMVFTLVVYVVICGSLSIMEIIHIWHPLTDIGRLVVLVTIFPLHSLTNPWMVSISSCLQLVLVELRKKKERPL